MKLELFGSPLTPHVQQIVALFLYQRIPFQFVPITEQNPPQWFLQMFPHGDTPALRLDNHFLLSSRDIISDYICNLSPKSLLPAAPLKRAQTRMLINWSDALLKNQWEWLSSPNISEFQKREHFFFRQLKQLERHLPNLYGGGSSPGLIDMVWTPLASRLQFVEYRFILEGYWYRHPNFSRWYLNVTQQKWWQRSVPKNFDELLDGQLRASGSWIPQISKEMVLR